ncbi:hypothetical protein BDZ97DRAFT_1752248 [Flammula alnicola]|nr:hypothetical protein BDZ97DRAFT_1752248 [Flammula alnicola]
MMDSKSVELQGETDELGDPSAPNVKLWLSSKTWIPSIYYGLHVTRHHAITVSSRSLINTSDFARASPHLRNAELVLSTTMDSRASLELQGDPRIGRLMSSQRTSAILKNMCTIRRTLAPVLLATTDCCPAHHLSALLHYVQSRQSLIPTRHIRIQKTTWLGDVHNWSALQSKKSRITWSRRTFAVKGWLGYADEKVLQLMTEAIAAGFNHFKMKSFSGRTPRRLLTAGLYLMYPT